MARAYPESCSCYEHSGSGRYPSSPHLTEPMPHFLGRPFLRSAPIGRFTTLLAVVLLSVQGTRAQGPCPSLQLDALVFDGVRVVKPTVDNLIKLVSLHPADFDCVVSRRFRYDTHRQIGGDSNYYLRDDVVLSMGGEGKVLFVSLDPIRYPILPDDLMDQLRPYQTDYFDFASGGVYRYTLSQGRTTYQITLGPYEDGEPNPMETINIEVLSTR